MDHSASTAPRWFIVLVLIAVVVGVALAFWFYGVVTAPAVPQ